jgi:hypothetical protein
MVGENARGAAVLALAWADRRCRQGRAERDDLRAAGALPRRAGMSAMFGAVPAGPAVGFGDGMEAGGRFLIIRDRAVLLHAALRSLRLVSARS